MRAGLARGQKARGRAGGSRLPALPPLILPAPPLQARRAWSSRDRKAEGRKNTQSQLWCPERPGWTKRTSECLLRPGRSEHAGHTARVCRDTRGMRGSEGLTGDRAARKHTSVQSMSAIKAGRTPGQLIRSRDSSAPDRPWLSTTLPAKPASPLWPGGAGLPRPLPSCPPLWPSMLCGCTRLTCLGPLPRLLVGALSLQFTWPPRLSLQPLFTCYPLPPHYLTPQSHTPTLLDSNSFPP